MPFFNTPSLDKRNICQICFLHRPIQQLGCISFRRKFQIVAPQWENIFCPRVVLRKRNLYKKMLWWRFPRVMILDIWHFTEKISKQWRKHIIGMFIDEKCYIVVVVKTFRRQNALLFICIFDAHWFEVTPVTMRITWFCNTNIFFQMSVYICVPTYMKTTI